MPPCLPCKPFDGSLTSLSPLQTPCLVEGSSARTPSLRMGMMRDSTRSPILRHSSPMQRAAMTCVCDRPRVRMEDYIEFGPGEITVGIGQGRGQTTYEESGQLYYNSSPPQNLPDVSLSIPSLPSPTCLSSLSEASAAMTCCMSTGRIWSKVLGVLTTTVFHTWSASLRTVY